MANRGGNVSGSQDRIKISSKELLSHNWGELTKYNFSQKRQDGSWQELSREVYDRGHGASCLLFNEADETVLLTRQFRLPAYLGDSDGYLIESPAGLLEGVSADERMRAELEEETGYTVSKLTLIGSFYMSPGSVTERLSCFIGTYSALEKTSQGGGKYEEGEDIEVLHIPLKEALRMTRSGQIADAKTVLLLQHIALYGLPQD